MVFCNVCSTYGAAASTSAPYWDVEPEDSLSQRTWSTYSNVLLASHRQLSTGLPIGRHVMAARKAKAGGAADLGEQVWLKTRLGRRESLDWRGQKEWLMTLTQNLKAIYAVSNYKLEVRRPAGVGLIWEYIIIY